MKIGTRIEFYDRSLNEYVAGVIVEGDEFNEMFETVNVKRDDTGKEWSVPLDMCRTEKSK